MHKVLVNYDALYRCKLIQPIFTPDMFQEDAWGI